MKKKAKVSKSSHIRAALARSPLASAKDIVGVLENAGISVSENLVHCVKADQIGRASCRERV